MALLVVAVVAVVLGAVALVVLPSSSVDVTGRVVDARTGVALEDVNVAGGEEIVTTDEGGEFTVQAESEGVLTFSAPGYVTGENSVAETLVVSLEPVVTSGRVTSLMTGQGLPASVTRDGIEVGASTRKGALTAYGVIAGDLVVVTAEGYEPRELTVREGDLDVTLQPEFRTSLGQIQKWVDAGKFGKAFGWVLREELDVSLVRDSWGQGVTDENVQESAGAFVAGQSTTPLGSNDAVDAYVVAPGRTGEATSAWTEGSTETFRVEGQRIVVGPHWDMSDVVVTLWWMDPLLVIAFTDTEAEGEEIMTSVMRGQGLDVDSFAREDAQQASA